MTSPFTIHSKSPLAPAAALTAGLFILAFPAAAFEGRITAASIQGGQATTLLYTVGTNALRLEVTGSDRPNPVDVLDLRAGTLTLLFPHNRSFVRLPPASEPASAPPPGFAPPPASLPSGLGPQTGTPAPPAPPPGFPPTGLPPGVGPQAQMSNAPGVPAMPQMPSTPGMGSLPSMPAMPMMPLPGEAMELKATGQKTNLLGFTCEQFEIKQRGEIMEVWATDRLLPFQNYVRNQSPRFGPRLIEERWAGLLTAKQLFPLRASLRYENGAERFRFEVLAVTPQTLKPEDAPLFLPPDGYLEIQPLPF
jgi:hypothetical protein